MNNKINVLLVADENVIVGLVTTMVSVYTACSRKEDIVFHIIDMGMTDASVAKIKEFFNRYRTDIVQVYKFDPSFFESKGARNFGGFGFAAYGRLVAADLLDCDKCIYIDSDILVTKDIAELWNLNLDDYAFAACRNTSKGGIENCDKLIFDCPFKYEEDISKYGYYNSGFMFCNLKYWRNIGVLNQTINLLSEAGNKLKFADQTVLNFIFRGKVFELHGSWNFTPWWTRSMIELSNLHFTSKHKPWSSRFYLPEEKMWYALYNSQIKPYWDIIKEKKTKTIKGFFLVLKQWLIPGLVPEVYVFFRKILRNDSVQKKLNDEVQFKAMRKKLYLLQHDKVAKKVIEDYCNQFRGSIN